MANEQESEELDLGEEKGGKSKLIIIIAIVAVVLIGGSAGHQQCQNHRYQQCGSAILFQPQ
ncbi:MAG: hypothetical protein ABW107_14245 [Candidatus Thiodiazotropha sp. 6PLUC5]